MAVATGSLAAVEQPVASRRLASLDVVRGLAVAVMVIVENLPGPLESFRWWRHAAWHGLTIADVVFPLFLVATGAGMAFWLRPPVSARTLRRLAVRSLALIAIGVVVFGWWGEGGGLDSLRIPGVLQRIGVAGLIAGVVVAGLRRWWAIAAVAALLLVGYGWTLTVADRRRLPGRGRARVHGARVDRRGDVRLRAPVPRRRRRLRPGGLAVDRRGRRVGAHRVARG